VRIVSNSSVLIALSAIGRLPLVWERFPSGIVIPQAVWREVVLEGGARPGAHEVGGASWIRVEDTSRSPMLPLLLAELDEGEAESIALACDIGADVILIDERDARRAARSMGLKVLGTVGILIWAKRAGRVPELRKELNTLQEIGSFRLSGPLFERALREAGEII